MTDSERSYFDGLTPFEATKELAGASKELVALLVEAGTIPKEAIPGWVAGAVVTALVEALGDVGSSYSVKIDPVHFAPVDANKPLTDWRWLIVSDINGAATHIVMVREKDLPQEIAIAVERSVMAHYDALHQR